MPTKIEWTDETWNPIRARNLETGRVGHFCVHESPGCKHCYSERMQRRFNNPVRFAAQDADKVELFLDEDVLTQPLRWRKPHMVFVCSMTDLFLDMVPEAWIDDIFGVMRIAHGHTFQVLTKRSERMRSYLTREAAPGVSRAERESYLRQTPKGAKERYGQAGWDAVERGWGEAPWHWLANIWLGVSVEDQKRADERIPHLLETPAAVRFLSVEPLLGPIALTGLRPVGAGEKVLHWVIVGGESGPNARPMHPNWARSIRDQCQAANAPFFFKQWGEWMPADGPSPEKRCIMGGNGHVRSHGAESLYDDDYIMKWAGKKRAGRLLDGREWNEVPG